VGGSDGDRRGLRLEEHPRVSVLGVAASIGAVWGLLGYSILWEGVPVTVQRPFVESVGGTLALLPVRGVLWAIHLAETLEHRTFDLSQNHAWIALVAGAVGTAICLAFAAVLRSLARRARDRAVR
jgi:hypothetical protein